MARSQRVNVTGLAMAALCCAALALAALAVDGDVAWYVRAHRCPRVVWHLLEFAGTLGSGWTPLALVAIVWGLHPSRRALLPRVAALAAIAGSSAYVLKWAVVRTRPRFFDTANPILDSFGGFLPMMHFDSSQQSFPSGHAATAMGLAIGMATMYPRHRIAFLGLALLAAMQRVVCGAHFVSDVLFGIGLAFATAALLEWRWPMASRRMIDATASDADRRLACTVAP